METKHATFDGSIPAHYDRYLGPLLFEPYARDLAARLALTAPAHVLELACGTGILTRALRERLPAEAQITATDLSEPMLAYAQAKLSAQPDINWEVADAGTLPYDAESFDAVLCQFGLMFVPDKVAALRAARRVLRPGGVYLANVWDSLERNQLPRLAHECVTRLFPDNPPGFYQVPFSMHDRETLAAQLCEAGFSDFTLTPVALRGESPAAQDAARGLVYGNPLITEIRERGTVEPDAVMHMAAAAITRECGAGPVRPAMQAIIIKAQK
jgi:ubiquinone/menaquinone biosynthesis C-methylase UbiE